MVEEFFTDEELQAVKNDLDTQIDHFANWLYKQGKIKSGWDAFLKHVTDTTFRSILPI